MPQTWRVQPWQRLALGSAWQRVWSALVPLGRFAALALEALNLGLSLMLVVVGVALIYRLGLNRNLHHPLFTRGILVAVIIWIAASCSSSFAATRNRCR